MLGDYLKAAADRRFVYGDHDCCTFPGDWVRLCGHPDPVHEWRGLYSTEAEAQALIADAGGLAELWTRGMARTICQMTESPAEGDIGVIKVLGESGPVENGGIFTGKRWAFLSPNGIFVSSIDPAFIVKVWHIV